MSTIARTGFLGIGAVAERVGAAPSTIRLWEARGLIPPALRVGEGGRRVYRTDDLDAIYAHAAKMRDRCRVGTGNLT